MDLRQLRYLEAVARHHHFTRAADELHVAQSALSQQVRRLEAELGVELFHRTTRSVEPTEAGELIADRARSILADVEALRGEVDGLRGLVRGRIAVGALLFGGALDIPALLAEFSAAFPGIEVGLREGTAQRMVEQLREGRLDVSFALEAEPGPGDLARLELSAEELVAATSPEHEPADPRPLSPATLADHRLIAFERGSSVRRLLDQALAAAGAEARIALEGNDMALVRSLVSRGLGVAVLPRSFVELPGPPISIRPLSPRLQLPVVLWWRRDRRLSPAAQAFVDFVDERRPSRSG